MWDPERPIYEIHTASDVEVGSLSSTMTAPDGGLAVRIQGPDGHRDQLYIVAPGDLITWGREEEPGLPKESPYSYAGRNLADLSRAELEEALEILLSQQTATRAEHTRDLDDLVSPARRVKT